MDFEKDLNTCEEEFDEDIIQLINEEGETVDFYHIATIEYEGEWYVFFEPAEELEDVDEGEVAVFKLESDENGEDIFVPLDDDELLDKVFAEFTRIAEEEERGCGCGCHDHGDCGCGKH